MTLEYIVRLYYYIVGVGVVRGNTNAILQILCILHCIRLQLHPIVYENLPSWINLVPLSMIWWYIKTFL